MYITNIKRRITFAAHNKLEILLENRANIKLIERIEIKYIKKTVCTHRGSRKKNK